MNRVGLGIVALAVGAIAFGTWQWSDQEVSIDLLPDPDQALMEPQVALKLTVLRANVLAAPQSAGAWGILAMNYDVHGLKPEAVVCYRQAAILDRREFRWAYFLAIVLGELEDPDVLDWFETARKLRPAYSPMLVRMGNIQFERGLVEQAGATFRASIEANSTVPQAFLGLARIALAAHDVDEAAAQVTAGLSANPGDRSLHGVLAEVHRRRAQMEEAAHAQRLAETLPPPRGGSDIVHSILLAEGVSSRWYQMRGQEYLSMHMIDSAIANLTRAVTIRPEANAHNDLGIALQTQGRFDEAIEQHRAALALRPGFVEAMVSVGAALQRTGRSEEAIDYLISAREINPSIVQIYINLAKYYLIGGRDREAVAALRSGVENGVKDVRISMQMAWLMSTSPVRSARDGSAAIGIAAELNEASPNNPYVLDVLAAAYAETGDFEAARETAELALNLAGGAGIDDLKLQLESRLTRYRSGMPFRTETN